MPCKRLELWKRENFSQDLAFKSGIGSDFQIWIKESASHILCITKMIALKSLKLNNISYKIKFKVLKRLPLYFSSLFLLLIFLIICNQWWVVAFVILNSTVYLGVLDFSLSSVWLLSLSSPRLAFATSGFGFISACCCCCCCCCC